MPLNSAINTVSLGSGFVFTDGAGSLNSTGGVLITKYTSNNTWTKNSKTSMITILAWNGGGGGGSGRQGTTAASAGGGGGASGSLVVYTTFANFFNATETVTI